MSQIVPDGPTDPRLSAVEDNTTIVNPGYGPPPGATGSPAAPFSSPLAPPIIPAPPGPVDSPVPPVIEDPRGADQGYGRVYGETRVEPAPAPEFTRTPELAGRGKTTVAEAVIERSIEKIVSLTAQEVAGVHGLYTGSEAEQAVSVHLDGEEVTIDIAIEVEFGHTVHELVEKVRASVISQTERLLGLRVTEVNVLVGDVAFDSPQP